MMMNLQQAVQILESGLESVRLLGDDHVQFSGVSIDSRTIKTNELFVALRGPNFDGHAFIDKAKELGATALIVDHEVQSDLPQIIVNDTRLALGRLAAGWRSKFEGTVIGITGSNGKTTVKEMLASILARRGEVLATEGNLNNDIGVPLMLLRLRPGEQRFAIFEMGANHCGEISYLSSLVQPDVALITNAASAHLEGFGSLDDVARAKGEIWQGLKESGIAIVNTDDTYADYWRELVADFAVKSFGLVPNADVHIGSKGVHWVLAQNGFKNRFDIHTDQGCVEVAMALAGKHNVMNALAAATTALAAGATLEDVQAGLNAMQPVKGRLQPKVAASGQLIIDDSYNANPQSLNAAIDVLIQAPDKTVLVMGDMAELGADAAKLHYQVGKRAADLGVTRLFATGDLSREAVKAFGKAGIWCENQQALSNALRGLLKSDEFKNAVVLAKGSRSSQMDRVVDLLTSPAAGEVVVC